MRTRTQEDAIPEVGTVEYKIWWESQYADAESHNIDRSFLSEIEWTDGFVGK